MQDQLPSDLVRVDRLFQRSCEAGINIQVQTIDLTQPIALENNHVV